MVNVYYNRENGYRSIADVIISYSLLWLCVVITLGTLIRTWYQLFRKHDKRKQPKSMLATSMMALTFNFLFCVVTLSAQSLNIFNEKPPFNCFTATVNVPFLGISRWSLYMFYIARFASIFKGTTMDLSYHWYVIVISCATLSVFSATVCFVWVAAEFGCTVDSDAPFYALTFAVSQDIFWCLTTMFLFLSRLGVISKLIENSSLGSKGSQGSKGSKGSKDSKDPKQGSTVSKGSKHLKDPSQDAVERSHSGDTSKKGSNQENKKLLEFCIQLAILTLVTTVSTILVLPVSIVAHLSLVTVVDACINGFCLILSFSTNLRLYRRLCGRMIRCCQLCLGMQDVELDASQGTGSSADSKKKSPRAPPPAETEITALSAHALSLDTSKGVRVIESKFKQDQFFLDIADIDVDAVDAVDAVETGDAGDEATMASNGEHGSSALPSVNLDDLTYDLKIKGRRGQPKVRRVDLYAMDKNEIVEDDPESTRLKGRRESHGSVTVSVADITAYNPDPHETMVPIVESDAPGPIGSMGAQDGKVGQEEVLVPNITLVLYDLRHVLATNCLLYDELAENGLTSDVVRFDKQLAKFKKDVKLSFGGDDRVKQLQNHFEKILSANKKKSTTPKELVILFVISNHFNTDVVHSILCRTKLTEYFRTRIPKNKYMCHVIGKNHIVKTKVDKEYLSVLRIIHVLNRSNSNVLYVGHRKELIQHLQKIDACHTYHVKTEGMTHNDMQKIENAYRFEIE